MLLHVPTIMNMMISISTATSSSNNLSPPESTMSNDSLSLSPSGDETLLRIPESHVIMILYYKCHKSVVCFK